jgi:hypothetical protein
MLAAACVLLLMTFGAMARAGSPTHPIDQSQGPPVPDPTMVGDPDAGHGAIVSQLDQLWIVIQAQFARIQSWIPATAKRDMSVASRRSTNRLARR